MKQYSDFKTNLREHHAQTSIAIPDHGLPKADVDVNLFAVENKVVLDRLNAAIAYITSHATLSPESLVNEIVSRVLHKAGLDVVRSRSRNEGNTVHIPLEQFGGRMGMTPEEGWVNDDGIGYKSGGRGLDLILTYNEGNGLHAISAEVVRVGGPEIVGVQEEEVEDLEEDIMFEVLDIEELELEEDLMPFYEAWDADSVIRSGNTNYGITMKKTPKKPFDYMKISKSTGKKYKVQFGLGKNKEMFTGTPEEVADKINDLFGFE
jgi:hypothetical protein